MAYINLFKSSALGQFVPTQLRDGGVPHSAVMLTAGSGSRMGATTRFVSKPLIYAGEQRLVEYMMDLLQETGVRDFTLAKAHLPKKIDEYVQSLRTGASKYAMSNFRTSSQNAAILKRALPFGSPFFIAGGDVVFTPPKASAKPENPITTLVNKFHETPADATLLVTKRSNILGYNKLGDYDLGANQEAKWHDRESGETAEFVYSGAAIVTPRFVQRYLLAKLRNKKASETTSDSKVDADELHNIIGSLADDDGILPRFSLAVHDIPMIDVSTPEYLQAAKDALRALTPG